MIHSIFYTQLIFIPQWGLIAPYVFPGGAGMIAVEVLYEFKTGKFKEARVSFPEGVIDVTPEMLKNEKP